VTVSAEPGCEWGAESSSSWITITSEPRGSGSGAVSYTVAARPGRLGIRGGRITIRGQSISIRQVR
jgi:hypothetical protein